MTDALHNLIEQVEIYRGTKFDKVQTTKVKSPYGKKIYDLNMAWAARRKEAMEALEAEEAEYRKEVEKYTKLHNAWASDNRQQTKSDRRGRPQNQWPDELKIAAAQAIRAGYGRSMVRTAIGISNTARFNLILAEGEELIQAQELNQRDKKIDAADAAGTEEW